MGLFGLPGRVLASGLILIAAVALTAPVAAQTQSDDEYRLALLKMKGQLGVARALLQLRAPGADHHLGAPLHEIFRLNEAELERRSAPFTADVLGELERAAELEPLRALATVEFAVNAVNGSIAQTGGLEADSVLVVGEGLLRAAVANYGDAVSDNVVVDLAKYQSGRGLVTEAEALVRHSPRLKGRPGHEELLKAVTLIRQAWPGIIPPPIVFDPPSVAARLDQAVAVMKKMK